VQSVYLTCAITWCESTLLSVTAYVCSWGADMKKVATDVHMNELLHLGTVRNNTVRKQNTFAGMEFG